MPALPAAAAGVSVRRGPGRRDPDPDRDRPPSPRAAPLVEHGAARAPRAPEQHDRRARWARRGRAAARARRGVAAVPARRAGARDSRAGRRRSSWCSMRSWSQARRMYRKLPAVRGLPILRLPDQPMAVARLRASPGPGQVSTIEAIARALRLLEGEAAASALERLFDVAVERVRHRRDAAVATVHRGFLSSFTRGRVSPGEAPGFRSRPSSSSPPRSWSRSPWPPPRGSVSARSRT